MEISSTSNDSEVKPDENFISKIYDGRSDDVKGFSSFSELMIDARIREILRRRNFFRPTPVQAKAIPLLIFGSDMIVQAKAGTGKTLIFSVLAAHYLFNTEKQHSPQVIVVAPTREIAKQIFDTIRHFAPNGSFTSLFVGGTDPAEDLRALRKGVQIAVGTTGRLADLIRKGALKTDHTGIFILDEADKLMESDFVSEVNFIFSSLPTIMKQVAVFSATYPKGLEAVLKNYMKQSTLLRLNEKEESLIAVKEYCVYCKNVMKGDVLVKLLSKVVFTQCIIFCDTQHLCERVLEYLMKNRINVTMITGNLPQKERFEVMDKLKKRQIKVLISTDLTARGIDATAVDLVVNATPSFDADTHIHRVGRAGRFGKNGAAIHLLHNADEVRKLIAISEQKALNVRVLDMNGFIPFNLPSDEEFHQKCASFIEYEQQIQLEAKFMGNIDEADPKPKFIPKEQSSFASSTSSVPSRSRFRKIYYLKKDLIALKEEITSKELIKYSESILPDVRIPTEMCLKTYSYEEEETSEESGASQPVVQNQANVNVNRETVNVSSTSEERCYDERKMISIKQDVSNEEWHKFSQTVLPVENIPPEINLTQLRNRQEKKVEANQEKRNAQKKTKQPHQQVEETNAQFSTLKLNPQAFRVQNQENGKVNHARNDSVISTMNTSTLVRSVEEDPNPLNATAYIECGTGDIKFSEVKEKKPEEPKPALPQQQQQLSTEEFRKQRDEQRRKEKEELKKMREQIKKKNREVKEVYINAGAPKVYTRNFNPIPASGLIETGPQEVMEFALKFKNYNDYSRKVSILRERIQKFQEANPGAGKSGKMFKRIGAADFEILTANAQSINDWVLDGSFLTMSKKEAAKADTKVTKYFAQKGYAMTPESVYKPSLYKTTVLQNAEEKQEVLKAVPETRSLPETSKSISNKPQNNVDAGGDNNNGSHAKVPYDGNSPISGDESVFNQEDDEDSEEHDEVNVSGAVSETYQTFIQSIMAQLN